MASHPIKDDKEVSKTMDDNQVHIAVGTVEERRAYTLRTLFRSVLFQMVLFGALSFVGPAMSDAITNLGGGGLSSPWLANLANSLSYTMSFFSTIIGGPIINRIGIKWACVIAALTMPLQGSSYYVNARYHNEAYLLAANVIKGIGGGFLYVGETTAMLSYPKPEDRGFYLGVWSAMRNPGSVIGGAINFSTNNTDSKGGGIAWATYLIYVGFECSGFIWALLLSTTSKVRRRDNSPVNMSVEVSWKEEFLALWSYLKELKTWLIFIPAFYSFFYGGTMGTYLSLHFSVRARALSSLIVPTITIPSVVLFGKLLDTPRWSQRRRAWTAMSVWGLLQMGCFIWIAVEYAVLPDKIALDYRLHSHKWARAYMPYLIIFVSGYWTQLTLYWILSTLSDDVGRASRSGGVFRAFETAGQAVAYGLSSANHIHHVIPLYVNLALLVLTIPSISLLITKMPRRPEELAHTVEEHTKQHEVVLADSSKGK